MRATNGILVSALLSLLSLGPFPDAFAADIHAELLRGLDHAQTLAV
jgi:hypothetical protein